MSQGGAEEKVLNNAGFDPEAWSLTEYRRWDVASRGGIHPCEYFKAKRILSPKIADSVIEKIQKYGQLGIKRERLAKSDTLLDLSLSDLHVGCRSGGTPAEQAQRGVDVARRLVSRARRLGDISKVLLTLVGDTLHVDSAGGTTTRGTALEDTSEGYDDLYEQAFSAVVGLTNWLARWYLVDVLIVPGNHDNNSSFHLARELNAVYEKDKRVDVIGSGSLQRHYFVEWGVNLLGYAHGDTGRLNDLPGLMSSSMPEAWGRTTHRAWKTGHRHSSAQFEKNGVQIRCLPALIKQNLWASNMGYHPTWSGGEADVYDKKIGHVATLFEKARD